MSSTRIISQKCWRALLKVNIHFKIKIQLFNTVILLILARLHRYNRETLSAIVYFVFSPPVPVKNNPRENESRILVFIIPLISRSRDTRKIFIAFRDKNITKPQKAAHADIDTAPTRFQPSCLKACLFHS